MRLLTAGPAAAPAGPAPATTRRRQVTCLGGGRQQPAAAPGPAGTTVSCSAPGDVSSCAYSACRRGACSAAGGEGGWSHPRANTVGGAAMRAILSQGGARGRSPCPRRVAAVAALLLVATVIVWRLAGHRH